MAHCTQTDRHLKPLDWHLQCRSQAILLTNIDGLSYMERVKFETDMQVDFVTDNLLVKGYERYSFGYYNWRSIFGSFPS